MKPPSTILAIFLCLGSLATSGQSSVTVTIEQQMLNQVIENSLPVRFKQKFKGSIGGVVPWSVTPTITINSMKVAISGTNISSRAKVSIKAEGLSYTETATGIITPKTVGQKIIFETTKLTLPLYVKPLGQRIDLGTQDISGMLSNSTKQISIDLLRESINIDIANGKKLSFKLSNPVIELMPGRMIATARFQTIE